MLCNLKWTDCAVVNLAGQSKEKRFMNVRNWFSDRFETLSHRCKNLADTVRGEGFDSVFEAPNKYERQTYRKRLLTIISLTVIFIIIVVISVFLFRYFSQVGESGIQFDEWMSSSGSFWGAVIGAVFAGAATSITTFFIIRRSYQIDYHRERLDALPVLTGYPMLINGKEVIDRDKLEISAIEKEYPFTEVQALDFDTPLRAYRLTNIGRGIAFKLCIRASERYLDLYYSTALEPNGKGVLIIIDPTSEEEIVVEFDDMYENHYRQLFKKHLVGETIMLISMPPDLVKRTERLRYTQ